MQRQRGLTLLELLVVLAIIGLAMTGVGLSLRDSSQTQLEREAQRLVAVLEAARAQSRTSGIALIWQATPQGFVIRTGLELPPTPIAPRTETWLSTATQARVSTSTTTANPTAPDNVVVLGPEPILASTRITLSVATAQRPETTLSIGTDGLRPFQVVP